MATEQANHFINQNDDLKNLEERQKNLILRLMISQIVDKALEEFKTEFLNKMEQKDKNDD